MGDSKSRPPRLNLADHCIRWPDEMAGPFDVRLLFARIGEEGRQRAECVGIEIRSFSSVPGPDGEAVQGWDPRTEEWIPPQPVTASLLRKVPIGGLIDKARSQAAAQSPVMVIASAEPPEWFHGSRREWATALEEDPRLLYYPPPEGFPGTDQEWVELPEEERFPYYPPHDQDWIRRNREQWRQQPPGRRKRRGFSHLADAAVVYARAFEDGNKPVRTVAEWGSAESKTAAMWIVRARKAGFLTPAEHGKAGGYLLPLTLEFVSDDLRTCAEELLREDKNDG